MSPLYASMKRQKDRNIICHHARRLSVSVYLLGTALLLNAAYVNADTGGDAVAGKALAAKQCAICHGVDGAGGANGPTIRGLPADRIKTQLQAFKSGTRKSMMMEMIAKKLSDEDIANLAAYFSSL